MSSNKNINISKRSLLKSAAVGVGAIAISANAQANSQSTASIGKVNVRDHGAVGDGVTDDLQAIQAVLNNNDDVYIPAGNYLLSDTLVIPSNIKLEGAGGSTNLIGSQQNSPVIMTFDGVSSSTNSNQIVRDFNVSGVGSCAVAFVHQSTSVVENISIDGFTGQDGFVFEYSWSNRYVDLKSNGAVLTRSGFQFNKVVLDCLCDMFYTSNLCDYGIRLDRDEFQYSVGSAVGLGNVRFNMPTVQGANIVGFYSNYNNVTVHNMYTENNARLIQIGEVGKAVAANTSFFTSRINGGRSGVSDILIENVSSVSFFDCDFDSYPLIIGGGSLADIQFYTPRVTGNLDFLDVIKRNDSTLSSFPVTIHRQVGTHYSEMVLKSTGWSWNMQRMTVDNQGNWQSTSWTPPKV
ncbi:glycosyl hydrolase family 28-related protein [Aliiglaciecola sp. M165]|uniref:glycosyl hydrolase family 28-related protein n=1 Tax=Aliiglaciecola sp. M165 TaxID=2593649 RepID=UPI00163D89FE|nr:glycosyl hydrolase family 28-related protein [Aliiglaciecola sp. M165]